MADGDIIAPRHPQFTHVKLIDAAASTDNGVWIDTGQLDHGSIHIIIATTATVQIRGSDAATVPANATDGYQVGSDVTATGGFDISNLPRWLKAKVSAWTSGQVDVLATLRPVTR
jgi:hypothetical protein